ncbi:hypothetical protein LX36DRAFT_702649 [Colletotrichum falcatum]|nr:hypothetical protein LX36DRAFT_702649 [Colletotrichum falcatum]
MNSFNPRRVSYLRPPTSVFEPRDSWATASSPYPSLSSIGYPASERTDDERFASAVWHRTFNHVDYAAYKAACDAERSAKPERNADVFSVRTGTARRGLSRLGAMLTVYPYRDMGWLATMAFLAAAVSFSLDGAFSLAPLLDPRLDFSGRDTAAQVTLVLGSSLLTLGAWMSLLAALNVDRAALDPKRDAPGAYKPALLGSDEWVWLPGWRELGGVFWPKAAFRAGVLQLLAGSFFTIAAVGALPGVLDLTHPNATIIFISSPQLIGGSFFVIAGLLVVFLSQDKWYAPLLLDASWQNGFWNLVGASGFLALGVVTLLRKNDAVVLASLLLMIGLGFLVASLIQWYIIMEYYPVDPYLEDPVAAAEIPPQSIY